MFVVSDQEVKLVQHNLGGCLGVIGAHLFLPQTPPFPLASYADQSQLGQIACSPLQAVNCTGCEQATLRAITRRHQDSLNWHHQRAYNSEPLAALNKTDVRSPET